MLKGSVSKEGGMIVSNFKQYYLYKTQTNDND